MNRIAILGCGAMGTVIGAYLAKSGLLVDMIDANKAHVDTLNATGAHILGAEEFTIPVQSILPEQMEGIYDLVFLMTKQTVNGPVLTNLLQYLGPDSVVCTLQNGIPEPFVAKYVGAERTVGGVIHWGATFKGPGTSLITTDIKAKNQAGVPLFSVGETDGADTTRIHKIADVLGRMGNTEVTTGLMDSRWNKLVYNCCGSGLSAACGCPYNGVLTNPKGLDCLTKIAKEVYMCAQAAGINLAQYLLDSLPNAEKCAQLFLRVYGQDWDGKPSMLQDLEAGRKTEVDMINGYVCAIGDLYGIDTPYNDMVVQVVHQIEAQAIPLSLDNLSSFPD